MLRQALLFGLILVAFDAAAAAIARAAAFNYGHFALLGIVIYVGFGIYAGQRLRLGRALLAIAIAAAIDASLGAYVAALIGPGRPAPGTPASAIVGLAAITGILSASFGAVGVVVGTRVRSRLT